MKIEIISDMGEVYDGIMEADVLIDDYIECLNEAEQADTIDFMRYWQTENKVVALDFIHDMWGIDYKIIG